MSTDKIDPKQEENVEPMISKDELSEKELEKASGGITVTKPTDTTTPDLSEHTI